VTDNASRQLESGDRFVPAQASSDHEMAPPRALGRAAPTRLARLLAGPALSASLLLSPATGNVSAPEVPDCGLVQRSSVLGAAAAPGSPSLAELADTAEGRMTPEHLALFREILGIRDSFGEPVDVNTLLRELREDA